MRGSVWLAWLVGGALLGAGVLGCGPIEYLNQVSRGATTAFAAAKSVDAERLAPSQDYTAQEYPHKAR